MSRLEHVRWLTESFAFNGKDGEHEEDLDQVGEDGRCIDNTGSIDNEIYFRLSSLNGATVSLVDPWTYSGSSVGAGRCWKRAVVRRRSREWWR